MASIFIYSAYVLMLMNLSSKQKIEHLGTPEVF